MFSINSVKWFYLVSMCMFSKFTVSVYVNELSPNVNCKIALNRGEMDREEDRSVMYKIVTDNETDYKQATSIFDFTVKDTYMQDISLDDYCRGYVTLVVNIASNCLLTITNYYQLAQLDREFAGKIRILAFPSNQFYKMMPYGDGDEMLCHLKSINAAPGSIMAKVDVNGDDAIPLYKYLKDQIKGELMLNLEWNFVKFLIDQNGRPIKRYGPKVSPAHLRPDIRRLLEHKPVPGECHMCGGGAMISAISKVASLSSFLNLN